MKIFTKLLLVSSCLLSVSVAPSITHNLLIDTAFAQDTEPLSISDIFKGETWVAYGTVNIESSNEKYITNFKDIVPDNSFKTFIEEIIEINNESIDESSSLYTLLKTVIMLKENPDNEEQLLQTVKIGSFDPEISADDSIINEVNKLYPDLNIVDANSISEDGSKSRVVLYYTDDNIYALSQKPGDEEKSSVLTIMKYLPINSPELDELRASVESYQNEEEAEAFNKDDYTPIEYTELMRDRDGKVGYKDTFYAEVMQYEEGSNKAIALLKKSGDSDKLYYAVFNTLPESRLVEGDNVDVYGTLDGLYTYDTVIGGSNTVPRIIIDEILVEGIDY